MLERIITSEKEYLVLVNTKELYDRAIELGYKDLALVTGDRLSPVDMEKLACLNRFVVLEFDCPEGNPQLEHIHRQLRNINIDCWDYNLATILDFSFSFNTAHAVEKMHSLKELEDILAAEGDIASTDYTDRCGNCHKHLDEEDKYCKYCGTTRGKGAFKPYYNKILVVYGPPVTTTRKCSSCGHKWTSSSLGGDEQHYCPLCGSGKIKIKDLEYDF